VALTWLTLHDVTQTTKRWRGTTRMVLLLPNSVPRLLIGVNDWTLVVFSTRRSKWQNSPLVNYGISHWSKQWGHSLNPNMPRVGKCCKRITESMRQ
jgi:hypothetical protein